MILVAGEGMLELARGDAGWALGHGGDTLNTAIHLARLGRHVSFVSALGADPFSAGLRADWQGEGLDLALLATDPARRAGLYAITTDEHGERSFTYWRKGSAAEQAFALADPAVLDAAADRTALFYFSMISLAILPAEGRAALFALARRVRAGGGRVAFDSNFRPALWGGASPAHAVHAEALALADIGLPTLDDEAALHGRPLDAVGVADAWRAAGVGEVIVKLGADGCFFDGAIHPVPARIAPLDTTGAGDAFNAGYLHARIGGAVVADAVAAGHRLAGWAITQRGGIPARTADAPYADLT